MYKNEIIPNTIRFMLLPGKGVKAFSSLKIFIAQSGAVIAEL